MINKITKTLKKYWKYLLGFIAILLSIFTLNKIRKRKTIKKIDNKIKENEKSIEKLEGKIEEVNRQKTTAKKKVVAKKKQIKKTTQQKSKKPVSKKRTTSSAKKNILSKTKKK